MLMRLNLGTVTKTTKKMLFHQHYSAGRARGCHVATRRREALRDTG